MRDHDPEKFKRRKERQEIAAALNKKYGDGTVTCVIEDQYRNMVEVIADHPEVLDAAGKATTGGRSCAFLPAGPGRNRRSPAFFRGLPCPNLGTGGCVTTVSMSMPLQKKWIPVERIFP